jgi:hypothetical protein
MNTGESTTMRLMIVRRRGGLAVLALAGVLFFVRSGEAQVSADSVAAEGRLSTPAAEKDPRLAGALSIFLPGLGQMYAGETVKGAVLSGLFVGSIVAVIGADIGETNGSIKPGGWSALALLGGVYLYALIDAPFAAHRANARDAQGALLHLRAAGIDLALDAGVYPGAIALRVTF